MVRREPDDLDAREPVADVDQQARVGAVEGEDRLRRIADEEQVVLIVTQQVDEAVLHRVEVLGLVDEEVPEAPTSRRREVVIVLQGFDGEAEHVVEVDHTASPLVVAVVGEVGGDLVGAEGGLSPGTSGLARVRLGRDGPRRRPVDLADDLVGRRSDRRSRAPGGDGRRPPSAAVCCDRPSAGAAAAASPSGTCRPRPARRARAAESTTQLARRLAGERERQRVAGVGGAGHDPVGDATGEHSGLAGTGPGDDRDQPRVGGDGVALLGVQIVEQRRGVPSRPTLGRYCCRPCRTRRSCSTTTRR